MTLHLQKTQAPRACPAFGSWQWRSLGFVWRPACVRRRRAWGQVLPQPWGSRSIGSVYARASGFYHSLVHEQDNKIMNDQFRCAMHCQRHTPCSHKAISWQVFSGLKNWFHFQPGPEVTTDNTIKMWFLDQQITETEEGKGSLSFWSFAFFVKYSMHRGHQQQHSASLDCLIIYVLGPLRLSSRIIGDGASCPIEAESTLWILCSSTVSMGQSDRNETFITQLSAEMVTL